MKAQIYKYKYKDNDFSNKIEKEINEFAAKIGTCVRNDNGLILSHNAYISAFIGHNEYTTEITIRAINNDRVLGFSVFDAFGKLIGFLNKSYNSEVIFD